MDNTPHPEPVEGKETRITSNLDFDKLSQRNDIKTKGKWEENFHGSLFAGGMWWKPPK